MKEFIVTQNVTIVQEQQMKVKANSPEEASDAVQGKKNWDWDINEGKIQTEITSEIVTECK